jgi:pimeloyl-ACP methyl ester carboxylesterase
MTLPRNPTRYRLLILPLIALACEVAEATSAPFTAAQVAAGHSEKIAGAGGVNLAIHEAGRAGAPPIVFIHGFSQNSLTWDHQFRDLAERFHVIAYDLRGHGASDKPLESEKYTDSALWADDLAAVIRARNLRRPVLVGWSYGGYVIADYVRKYGDAELGGIVFLAAVTKQGSEEAASYLSAEVLGIFGDLLSPDVRSSISGTIALVQMFATQRTWNVAFGSAMMVAPEIRLAMFSRSLENDDVLERIRVPTLVVHGAADRIVNRSAAEHMARTIPGARLLVYNGAGHAMHLDHAVRLNRDLAEFVRSVR